MRKLYLSIVVLCLAAFVAGCRSGAKLAPQIAAAQGDADVSAAPVGAAPAATQAAPRLTLAPSATPTAAPSATPSAAPTATATATATLPPTETATAAPTETPTPLEPLSIEYMRQQAYPGSDFVIERKLSPGANYQRYVASYLSDGLKIYGLLTIPNGPKPETGWPAIVFNHGYIPPAQYRTTQRYVAYQDAFARAGYVTIKPDYRGHDKSEGEPEGGYGSPGYTIDVLNALGSLKRHPDVDPNRIGMWGHSMGGNLTLRAMVVSKDIKAGVIWGGVVASYPDMMTKWRRPRNVPTPDIPQRQRRWRQELTEKYGTPEENPAFWASISPISYLADLSGPLQLQHSTTDEEVPVAFSRDLVQAAKVEGISQPVEYYEYPGDNHNISKNLSLALKRSVEFFDRYVKNAGK